MAKSKNENSLILEGIVVSDEPGGNLTKFDLNGLKYDKFMESGFLYQNTDTTVRQILGFPLEEPEVVNIEDSIKGLHIKFGVLDSDHFRRVYELAQKDGIPPEDLKVSIAARALKVRKEDEFIFVDEAELDFVFVTDQPLDRHAKLMLKEVGNDLQDNSES